jgi:hypothetical protein
MVSGMLGADMLTRKDKPKAARPKRVVTMHPDFQSVDVSTVKRV